MRLRLHNPSRVPTWRPGRPAALADRGVVTAWTLVPGAVEIPSRTGETDNKNSMRHNDHLIASGPSSKLNAVTTISWLLTTIIQIIVLCTVL